MLVPFLVLIVGEVELASQGLVGFDLVHNRIDLDDVATNPWNIAFQRYQDLAKNPF